MPRMHVNLKIEDQKFQLSVLDPFFHRSYNQAWLTAERNPKLVHGHHWRETDVHIDFARALDQAVLACSGLSKKIALGAYPEIKSIIVHISRNDVIFMLELNNSKTPNDILLKYTWDQNAQLIEPNNFKALEKIGINATSLENLHTDLTQCSFGRLGLVARCMRLMSQKQQNHLRGTAPNSQIA